MKNAVICLMVICCSFNLSAQKTKGKSREYKVWVELKNNDIIKGYLIQLKDSAIVIVENTVTEPLTVSIANIEELKFRRKGKIGLGMGIGAGAGLAAGAIVGFSSGDDEPGFFSMTAEDKAIASGILLLPVGAGIGALVGTGRSKYPIHGELNNYIKYRSELDKYILVKGTSHQ